jgi:hypothetical protein
MRIWMFLSRSLSRRPTGLAALTLMLALAAPASAQQSNATFTINNVPVDATASSSAQAREIAIAQGEQAALKRLFDSMVLKQDQPFLPALDTAGVAGLVDGISVNGEKVSRTRYLAQLTVYFKADAVRNLLQRTGIAFSETVSKPVLVLPVLETAGFVSLWTDPNPWLAGWQTYDQIGSHVPFILPKGGAEEAAAISANDIITGNPDTVAKLESTYGVTDVYLAYANLYLDPSTNAYVTRVLFMRFGDNPAVLADDTVPAPADAAPDQRLTALMTASVADAVGDLVEAWKRETIVHYGAEVSLPAVVPVATLADWVAVKDKLEKTAVVRAVDVTSMTVHEARIAIKYLGNPDKLALALAQSDLQLTQGPSGDWVVTSSGAQASQ